VTSITQTGAVKRRRMTAADRREAILAAGLDAFSEGGYHETSLEKVAARAGVSKALIYEHFRSKRELHGALLEMYVGELLGRVGEAIAGAEPGAERMRAGVDSFFAFVEERRGAWRMLFRNVEDPEIADGLARLQSEAASTVAALMAADAEEEGIADPDFEVAIEMFAQQLTGAVQWLANWWDEHRGISRKHLVAVVMDFAWLGLERVGAGERWRN
jgi:AcrR family transcriptional regulator